MLKKVLSVLVVLFAVVFMLAAISVGVGLLYADMRASGLMIVVSVIIAIPATLLPMLSEKKALRVLVPIVIIGIFATLTTNIFLHEYEDFKRDLETDNKPVIETTHTIEEIDNEADKPVSGEKDMILNLLKELQEVQEQENNN